MQLLSPDRIKKLGQNPKQRTAPVEFGPIDFTRPFIPEEFTQLYYTPLYADLTHEQRLRYNQLFAIRVSEMVAVSEEDFTARLLTPLTRHPRIADDPDLVCCLVSMVEEEQFHSSMFHDLNRRCLPEIYEHRDRYFAALRPLDRLAFSVATAAPYRLTFLLWFMTALEEYSTGLSHAYVRNAETESLGPLELNHARLHVEHAKDETRHVHTGLNLIERCHSRGTSVKRRVNAMLFKKFIGNVIVPKRGGAAVIRHLLLDRPELKPIGDDLIRALRDLEHDERFQKSLFNRRLMPQIFRHLDRQSEFETLGDVMLGYDRRDDEKKH